MNKNPRTRDYRGGDGTDEGNYIYLFSEVNSASAEYVIRRLFLLDAKMEEEGVPRDERVITLVINSPGGSVSDGRAIFDCMNCVKARVETICTGLAASMGAFLLSSGTKGMRRATENAEIMIHQPLGGVSGQATDILLAAGRISKTRDWMNRKLAEETGQSVERIAADTERDYCLTAEEAKAYGLIDEVIPSVIKSAVGNREHGN